jgi:hypothetical protein
MAEQFYRIPIANAVIKVSSIEYVTPIVPNPYANNLMYSFRVVYNNYTSIPVRFGQSNNNSSNTGAVGALPTNPMENGFNATVQSANTAQLEAIRTDIINVLTSNGANLINNFPDL